RERQDCRQGKAGARAQGAERVTEVLEQRLHFRLPPFGIRCPGPGIRGLGRREKASWRVKMVTVWNEAGRHSDGERAPERIADSQIPRSACLAAVDGPDRRYLPCERDLPHGRDLPTQRPM